LRGGRRYFRKLKLWPASVSRDLDPRVWHDLWHVHPDFHGWSLRSGKARHAHLEVLFEAFRMVLQRVARHSEPYQVFVSVNTDDSPGDALYFHTPNPNERNFPHTFDGYRWDIAPPPWLAKYIDRDRFEVGETHFEGEKRYVVVPRGKAGRQAMG